MFGLRMIATGSREDLEESARDVLEEQDKEELINDKIEGMDTKELREFVEENHPDFKEDDVE